MKTNTKLLILILLLAAFLRLSILNTLPISLFGDEIDVGYQAWSLITTGRDYMGHLLPTYLQSFSEWRTPLLSYLLSPVIGLFGPSTFSVRLPVAFLGVLNIYLLYLLTKKLFLKNDSLPLISAFILTIMPWHIHFSRMAVDTTLLLSLLLIGTILLVSNKLLLSLPFFILTFYTYQTANVFTPVFLVILLMIYRPQIQLRKHLPVYSLYLIALMPILLNILIGPASDRIKGISIFSDQKITDSIIQDRTQPWIIGSKLEPIFHNKPLVFLQVFTRQYLSALSPQFLFESGDPNFRHSVGEIGELYPMFAPFLLLGFVYLMKNYQTKESKVVLAWLFLSPIPSAITLDGGSHAIRLSLMIIPLALVTSLGFLEINSLLRKNYVKIIIYLFVIFSFINLTSYWHHYSSHYLYLSAKNWQYGYEQIFSNLPPRLPNSNFFINNTNEPSLLKYLFFAKVSPKEFQSQFTTDATSDNIFKDQSGFIFGDSVYFLTPSPSINLAAFMEKGDWYLAVQNKEIPGDWDWSISPPSEFKVIRSAKDPYGRPLFTLIEKL